MADLVVVEHDTVVVVQEIGTQVVEVVSAGPQGIPGSGTWAGISDKPTVIAAGATQAEARTAIGAVADNDPRLTDSRAPTGVAGGVLSGAYPNPGFAVDMATQAELDAHAINASNPHAVTAAQAGADPAGTAAAAVAAHTADTDPHPQYTTTAEAAAAAPVQSVAGKTGAVVLAKADVGLGNVDNTSDAAKPVSTAQQTALNAKVAASGGTASGLTLNDGYTEEVFAVTGTTPALSPTNGSIQTWTLTGNSTPTAGTWASGQSMTLMVDDGSAYTINWASMSITWKTGGGTAPTLLTSGYTVIELAKVGSTIYGWLAGDA